MLIVEHIPRGRKAPVSHQVLLHGDHLHALDPNGEPCALPLINGLQMAWVPLPGAGGAVVMLYSGDGSHGTGVIMSISGIASLAHDLNSIVEQLGELQQGGRL